MANLGDMNFMQSIIFWTMVGAMVSTFVDIERRQLSWEDVKPDPGVDNFQPVNRRLIDMAKRQL